MRHVVVWLLCGAGLVLAQGQRLSPPAADRDVQRLARATLHAASRHIATRINTLVVRQHCLHCAATLAHQHGQLIDALLHQLSRQLAVLLFKQQHQPATPIWDYTLFVVNEARAFEELQLNGTQIAHDREFYFLIVLVARLPEAELRSAVTRMCYRALQSRIINVVVMAPRDNGQIRLYTYRLFGKNCTPGIHTYESNRILADGTLLYPELFPVRFTNLSHCALNVTGHLLPPHFMYRSPQNAALPAEGALVDLRDLLGIDGELLRLLASALRFKVRLKIPLETSNIFSDDSLSGCFAELASGRADLAIGGFSGSDRRRTQFATSAVYHQSYFIFVVRAKRYFGPLGQLMHPFRPTVWLCLMATLLAALICVRCLRWRLPLRHPFENMLAVATGNPMPVQRVPRSSFQRHLLANWLLLTLVLRCAYQAKLFDVLRTVQHEPLPLGLAGLLRQNYTLISTDYHDFYPRQLTHLLRANFSQRYQALLQAPPEDRLATISLDNNLAHWQRVHPHGNRLTHVRKPIYLYQVVIYFPKDTIFKFSINRKIEQLLSSGVLSHISRRYLPAGLVHMSSNVELVTRITNDMLNGFYRCYVVLLLLAGCLLLLERLSLRYAPLRRLLDWLQ